MVDIKPNIQGGMSQSCETLKCVKLVYSQKYKNDRFWKHLNDLLMVQFTFLHLTADSVSY